LEASSGNHRQQAGTRRDTALVEEAEAATIRSQTTAQREKTLITFLFSLFPVLHTAEFSTRDRLDLAAFSHRSQNSFHLIAIRYVRYLTSFFVFNCFMRLQIVFDCFLWRCEGAGSGDRTRMTSLEGWDFTIKLCPRRKQTAVTRHHCQAVFAAARPAGRVCADNAAPTESTACYLTARWLTAL
jgi:hypothetical protein